MPLLYYTGGVAIYTDCEPLLLHQWINILKMKQNLSPLSMFKPGTNMRLGS